MVTRVNKTILYLIDTTGSGGAETVFAQLADEMRKEGWRTIVVIRGAGWLSEELERRGLPPIILDAKGSFNLKFLLALIKVVRKEQVSLIHSHLLGSNVYAALVGLLVRCPVIATYHGVVDVGSNERFKTIKHWVMRWGIDRYVSVSKSLAHDIHKNGLLAIEKNSVIYNGIDVSLYKKNNLTSIRDQLGLSSGALLVGCLGNVRPSKAYNILIEAASLVIKDNPDIHFVIAGDKHTSQMVSLEEKMEVLGVSERVHFIGFQKDSALMLGQMDIFLLSSISEGFSISTIEAMATGLPVIATRCGGPEEIVTHEENGWLVEKGNPDAIAGSLNYLIENPKKMAELGVVARQHVYAVFSSSIMVQEYNKVYRLVLGR